MLREWITYLRTSCSKEARRLGYLHEAIAIRERHARNREAWEAHLRDCQNFVMKAATECRGTGDCVILGSGLLLDVPLAELAQKFARVHLVDLVHLPEVHQAVRSYANVKLKDADVTGLVRPLAKPNRALSENPMPQPAPPRDLPTGDLVVSLNLLSQLPLRLINAACAGRSLPQAALAGWIKDIQQSHWDWLRTLAPCRCIITDQKHTVRNRDGEILRVDAMVDPGMLPNPQENWSWQLAPPGEINRSESTEADVSAWIIND